MTQNGSGTFHVRPRKKHSNRLVFDRHTTFRAANFFFLFKKRMSDYAREVVRIPLKSMSYGQQCNQGRIARIRNCNYFFSYFIAAGNKSLLLPLRWRRTDLSPTGAFMSSGDAVPASATKPSSSLTPGDFARAWWRVLNGHTPMLSIEITRECPLSCPGCYAYGDSHLGSKTTLRDLSDFRGEALVEGVLELVRRHRPMHVSLVGGEPMIRHRELDRILPALGEMGVFTMVVTSGVIAIPEHWMKLQRLRVAVSVDGLPEHHDDRRKPATYERILKNIAGRRINIHWVITRPMLARASYLEEYVAFWNARTEVDHIWVSLYSPQMEEESAERLTQNDRELVAEILPPLRRRFPKLLMSDGMGRAFLKPPENPEDCLFSKMSTNYSADLRTHVEPCVFGGSPDCSQCGCSISSVLHWVDREVKILGVLKMGDLVRASLRVGLAIHQLRGDCTLPNRWPAGRRFYRGKTPLVQIHPPEENRASGCSS
jgi:organic radical activating enzyme